MLEFARWKYIVIAVVLLFTTLYSIPNLYPKDPAVQITANRGAPLDAGLQARTLALLKTNGIAATRAEIEEPDRPAREP
jgi:preprotein translocase subunit SecD